MELILPQPLNLVLGIFCLSLSILLTALRRGIFSLRPLPRCLFLLHYLVLRGQNPTILDHATEKEQGRSHLGPVEGGDPLFSSSSMPSPNSDTNVAKAEVEQTGRRDDTFHYVRTAHESKLMCI